MATIFKKRMAMVLISAISFLLVSCHSDYLTMDYKTHPSAQWNDDHTQIAFIASKSAYRNAIGMSKFPDGGTPKYLIKKMGLYVFNPQGMYLRQIVSFDDLANWQGNAPAKWKSQITFTDSAIYYKIEPLTEWKWYESKAKSKKDSLLIKNLKAKYMKAYAFKMTEDKEIGEDIFNSIYQSRKEKDKIGLTELNKMLSNVPLADWGLMVKEILPKADNEYVEETIYLDNDCFTTRRAVIEQIIAKKGPMEINHLLKKMDNYKKTLKGVEKMEYETNSKETYDKIKALL